MMCHGSVAKEAKLDDYLSAVAGQLRLVSAAVTPPWGDYNAHTFSGTQ